MSFIDQLGKTISQGVDRARFEAEKLHRTSRIQGEIQNLKRDLDQQLIELGQRAYDLHRAGQIHAPSIATMAHAIDRMRADIIKHEEELKAAQADNFEVQPAPPMQSVTVTREPAASEPVHSPQPAAGKKPCPTCGFHMPLHAVFCPNCGFRVGR